MKKLLVFLISPAFLVLSASATTIYVPGNYSTIQAGVNAASNGDTVLVAPGTYPEQVTIQNAVIHLISSEGVDVTKIFVSGSGGNRCLIVHNSSEISGFHLRRTAAYWSNAALEVMDGSPFIHHNLIHSGSEGPTCVKISGAGLQGITLGPSEISANPLWSNYHLTPNSPCVDAGVPVIFDPDFTTSDMGYLYYDQGTPSVNLTLTLTPQTLPIEIPASGGSFNYQIALSNPDSLTVPTDIWSKITIPAGTLFGPIWGPLNYNLPPFFNQSRDKVQAVPASAPAGEYVFRVFIGLYPATIWDHKTIPFTKLATDEKKPTNP